MCEVFWESGEILQGGAAPFVDRLIWITHGRNRESISEDLEQELSLGRVGVLVFIEKHNVVPMPDPFCDCGAV